MINTTIPDYFRRINQEKNRHDPATEFNFIPSWDKEFLTLLGLEEVVQARLELMDKTVSNKPKTLKIKGKKKKMFPEPAEEPSTPPEDPLICAQCKTDFSCSWKKDSNGLCSCLSCFKCNWRKEDQSSYRPKEPSTSGNSSSSALISQSINFDHWAEGGGAFSPSLSASAHFQSSDLLVPKVSALHVSPDNTSSSFLSSSSFSSDLLSSPFNDNYSSSSSSSPSPPPLALYLSKKVERMNLTKDKQEMEESKEPLTCYRPPQKKEKEDRSSYRPKEPSTSGNSSSSALISQSINFDHWAEGGGAFSPSLSASAHFQSSDLLVPKVSALHVSPDNTSSSFLSSSSFSSDLLSSPFNDNYSSSSSSSPSLPPLALYLSKKVERKSLTKEKQEMEESKEPLTCYRPPQKNEKTKNMPCGSLSSASSSAMGLKQNDTQKAQVPEGGSKASTLVRSARKLKFEPPKLMPFLKKMTKVKHSGSSGKFTSAEP